MNGGPNASQSHQLAAAAAAHHLNGLNGLMAYNPAAASGLNPYSAFSINSLMAAAASEKLADLNSFNQIYQQVGTSTNNGGGTSGPSNNSNNGGPGGLVVPSHAAGASSAANDYYSLYNHNNNI